MELDLGRWLLFSCLLVLVLGIIGYQKMNDETYDGMSVIPEKRKDIGLYKGLEPRRTDYVIDGNHAKGIYEYYLKNLPKHGWKLEFKDSNKSSAYARWNKEGQGVLNIQTSYIPQEKNTEVMFDLD